MDRQVVGALRPNWFDTTFGDAMEKANAEEALALLAKEPRIVKTLNAALADYDKPPQRVGPSRTQVIRRALAEVLNAD